MEKSDQSGNYKKFLLFVVGFFVLILGITLILVRKRLFLVWA